jgi:hypothetical protein
MDSPRARNSARAAVRIGSLFLTLLTIVAAPRLVDAAKSKSAAKPKPAAAKPAWSR